MARPRATPEQRHLQRGKIRRAAAEIYRTEGLSSVTVRAISERAGVSTGTLYSYFANLEALMQSLWTEPVERVNRELENLVDDYPDPLPRIRALLEAYAQFATDQPEVFNAAVLFVRPASAKKPDVEPLDELPFYRLVKEAVEEGQVAGQIGQGDSRMRTQVLWAGIHGALALPVNIDRYTVDPQAILAPAMIDALMATLTQDNAR